MRRRALAAGTILVLAAGPAAAKVFLTVDEALRLAFPGATLERRTIFLTEEQQKAVRDRSGGEFEPSIVHPYVATKDGSLVGTAYLDVHRVRTLPETLMVVVAPDGRVLRVEVLSFDEPPDYMPRAAWYRQFEGLELSERLALKRDVRGVSGATLTARATTNAVRRVLALHGVLQAAAAAAGTRDAPEGPTSEDAPPTRDSAPPAPDAAPAPDSTPAPNSTPAPDAPPSPDADEEGAGRDASGDVEGGRGDGPDGRDGDRE